jgi:catalytic LigB subunit of aromatic ring-opening dioxygenase
MIELGIASSHAPALFCPKEIWPKVYANIPDYMKGSQPHTAKLETSEVIEGYIKRINAAFDELRGQLESFRPDALVIVGDDEGDMFNDSNFPTINVFTGPEVWGATAPYYLDQDPAKSRVRIPVHSELAMVVLKGLMRRGFDPAHSSRFNPVGRPERGVSHMVVYPGPKLYPKFDIPIVPIFLNEYYPPLPSGRRCWDLGVALADILKDRSERIAIFASGGLSHDPFGPRAGWIDEPLDRWLLERIAQNRGEELANLFSFDSATLHGGSGEIRAWIVAAGACQWPARVLDYIPIHHAKTGVAFAYWPTRGR